MVRSAANRQGIVRDFIVSGEWSSCLHHGCRAGRHVCPALWSSNRNRKYYVWEFPVEAGHYRLIPTIITTTCHRQEQYVRRRELHTPTLQRITKVSYTATTNVNARSPILPAAPSLYVLNAAVLSKPGAVGHLAVDLKCYGVSVAIITETHFKNKRHQHRRLLCVSAG